MVGVGRGRDVRIRIYGMGRMGGFVLSADDGFGYSYEKSRRQRLASRLTALIDWGRIAPVKERGFSYTDKNNLEGLCGWKAR